MKKSISGFGAARSGTTFLSFDIGEYIDHLYMIMRSITNTLRRPN